MSLTIAENFAAAQVLTDWPDNFTYDQLLDAITDQHEDVLVWEQYEDELPDTIVQIIEDLRVQFLVNIANMTEDLRNAIKQGDPMTIAEQLASFERQIGE